MGSDDQGRKEPGYPDIDIMRTLQNECSSSSAMGTD